jgi:hypothetical protein
MTLAERYQDAIEDWQAWRTWHRARTYNDLLEMNIDILCDRLDHVLLSRDADRLMLHAMIELNRCGIFAYLAQPGGVNNRLFGDPIEHRAAIQMIVPDAAWNGWLKDDIYDQYDDDMNCYDLTAVELHTEEERDAGIVAIRGLPVTRRVGTPENGWRTVGYLGKQATAAELHRAWPVKPDAAAQLYRGWQITLCDLRWGDSDLFTKLAAVAKEYQIRHGMLEMPNTPDPAGTQTTDAETTPA